MRLATFNILHGRTVADGVVDLERLRAAVKAIDADVLGLQEVDCDQPRSQLADLYKASGQQDKALADYQKSTELAPDSPGSYAVMGDIYSDEGQYKQAIEYYSKAI